MTARLTLAYSAPTDEATKAWEKARPKGDSNPPLSPAFRALCETADVARGGVDALIEALQEALETIYVVAQALESHPSEENLLDAIQEILDEAKSAREQAEEAEDEREAAERRLEGAEKEFSKKLDSIREAIR